MCGEKSADIEGCNYLAGSPPRVRGKVRRALVCVCDVGITPACAGKSSYAPVYTDGLKDHPRVCGEKLNFCHKSPSDKGSPPRVRGKDDQERRELVKIRITPACAGKRAVNARGEFYNKDHPRVCGEKNVSHAIRA